MIVLILDPAHVNEQPSEAQPVEPVSENPAGVIPGVLFFLLLALFGLAFAIDFRGVAAATGQAQTWRRRTGTPETAARRVTRLARVQRVIGAIIALFCASLAVALIVAA